MTVEYAVSTNANMKSRWRSCESYLVWTSCSSLSPSSFCRNWSAFISRSIDNSLPSSLDMLLQWTRGCRWCCCTIGGGWKHAYTECVSKSEQLPAARPTLLWVHVASPWQGLSHGGTGCVATGILKSHNDILECNSVDTKMGFSYVKLFSHKCKNLSLM